MVVFTGEECAMRFQKRGSDHESFTGGVQNTANRNPERPLNPGASQRRNADLTNQRLYLKHLFIGQQPVSRTFLQGDSCNCGSGTLWTG